MNHRKVFIIGAAGLVGANTARLLTTHAHIAEIILIDVAATTAHGQAMDIEHASVYTAGVPVRIGDYSDIAKDDIIVVTAGLPRLPHQTRLQLVETNARIMKDIVEQVVAAQPSVFLLIVANPVDILTQIALAASGLPPERVFGTGTTLDTARLRSQLGRQLGVSPAQVEGYVLGEHGNSSFVATSSLTIGGIPLAAFPGATPDLIASLTPDIRAASQKIIEAKKSTYFGISQVVADLVEAMLRPIPQIFPACTLATGQYGLHDVVIGLPTLVSEHGATILEHYPLTASEQGLLKASTAIIRGVVADYTTQAA